ncbi:MAG TPA: type II toxin-antitoxin system RelE/ParE family toxin [Tepidisphaeraceae bacterium]|nr:type II toxin-antitoxin system RelE/ParE family toxin [Tepidisphaeraceae bacterium]
MAETFRIRFAREAADDIRGLKAFDKRRVIDGIQLFLAHDPCKASRSRIKLMVQPFWSQYRLRINDFRVYYDVDEIDAIVQVVRVLAKTTETTPTEQP